MLSIGKAIWGNIWELYLLALPQFYKANIIYCKLALFLILWEKNMNIICLFRSQGPYNKHQSRFSEPSLRSGKSGQRSQTQISEGGEEYREGQLWAQEDTHPAQQQAWLPAPRSTWNGTCSVSAQVLPPEQADESPNSSTCISTFSLATILWVLFLL